MVPDPPAGAKPSDVSASCMVHSAAACVTLALWSFSSITARRVEASLFDDTTYSTDPSPCPLDTPRRLSHGAFELAVHAHSRAVVMASDPVPPDAGTLRSVVASVTPHRGKVAGAVEVVDEDPQAVASTAASKRAKKGKRWVIAGRPMPLAWQKGSTSRKLRQKGATGERSVQPFLKR